MIYFKFPFDEKLYSTDGYSDKKAVLFKSFDQSESIIFNGDMIEINDKTGIFLGESFVKDETRFSPENHEEYVKKLQKVIEVIKENQLPKLVLSRRKIFRDFNEINAKESFRNLCEAYPNAFRYIFIKDGNSWMGAFSEVLGKFNKSTHEFETMSLAGTIPISESWTDKEIEEQKPVSSYIRNVLQKFNTNAEIYESETYDHISGNIKHLRTDFKLKINPQDLDAIIEELHPTPAVCGIPKDFCQEKIRQFEKFPRELYAGFIRIETDEFIQYFVNLRCAKLYSDSVHIFTGGGITAQSNPEKEWIETELKSEAVLKNLVFSI
ncbi:chorismate-binding protein [Chryseobacterium chendengshani]|uniref:chorismate-binding protein n=1 Tax=Chryseobacterium sp. LJ668 TaxID=2864040 RepID=UPI001C69399B|nr:chorismate-binding protein [Chryseobacterium sp. LJ668]MBW8523953.1 chorismate-binding protein [Chryseobacterium sp. LJ668]QYK16893.1 chorismate-binding protein [Chryseobacterium sp. LJ668]